MSNAAAALLLSLPATAEEAPESDAAVRVEVGLTGMLGASYWGDRASLTFGGPRLVLAAGRFGAGLSFYPSLVYIGGIDHPVRPALGFGPELSVDQVVFVMPIYHVGDRFRPMVGGGYRF